MQSFDVIGNTEALKYSASGSGAHFFQPVLDVRLKHDNKTAPLPDLNFEETKKLLIDGMTSAAEQDLLTGDSMEIVVITKDGIQREEYPLRRD